jgi:hypothetical protein
VKHTKGLKNFVGLIIDMEKRELSIVLDGKNVLLIYSEIPDKLCVLCCVAHDMAKKKKLNFYFFKYFFLKKGNNFDETHLRKKKY